MQLILESFESILNPASFDTKIIPIACWEHTVEPLLRDWPFKRGTHCKYIGPPFERPVSQKGFYRNDVHACKSFPLHLH